MSVIPPPPPSECPPPPPPPPRATPVEEVPAAARAKGLQVGTRIWAYFFTDWFPATVRRFDDDNVEVLWDTEYSVSWVPLDHVAAIQLPASEASVVEPDMEPDMEPAPARPATESAVSPVAKLTEIEEDALEVSERTMGYRDEIKHADTWLLQRAEKHAVAKPEPVEKQTAERKMPAMPTSVPPSVPCTLEMNLKALADRVSLSASSVKMLLVQSDTVQKAVLHNFQSPDPGTRTVDEHLERYVAGIKRNLDVKGDPVKEVPVKEPVKRPTTNITIKKPDVEAFVKKWKLEARTANFLLDLPEDVLQIVLDGFKPVGNPNIEGIIRGYAKSVMVNLGYTENGAPPQNRRVPAPAPVPPMATKAIVEPKPAPPAKSMQPANEKRAVGTTTSLKNAASTKKMLAAGKKTQVEKQGCGFGLLLDSDNSDAETSVGSNPPSTTTSAISVDGLR